MLFYRKYRMSEHWMVIGAGRSLVDYGDRILAYIKIKKPTTIGVNKMVSLCYPDFHLWTNAGQYKSMGDCVDGEKSRLLFNYDMSRKLIRMHHNGGYEKIKYVDKKGTDLVLNKKRIKGHFRTSGVLAIAIAHCRGAKTIEIVGMDGYTFRDKDDVFRKKTGQHCWGKGHTDVHTWDEGVGKDQDVYDSLREIHKFGVKFRILTPTVFEDFYDGSVL